MSLAARAASIPIDAAVPTPGIVPAAPLANSNPAPTKSPLRARLAANTPPATRPTPGIFLSADLKRLFPKTFAPVLAPALAPTFSAALAPPPDNFDNIPGFLAAGTLFEAAASASA